MGYDQERGFERAAKLARRFLLVVLLGATFFGACNGPEPEPVPDPDYTPDDEDPWNVGGAGGAPPLFGEGGRAPDELRLVFEPLRIFDSGGGTDMAFLPNASEVLVTLREGELLHLKLEGGETTTLQRWIFQEGMLLDKACGLTNIVIDPNFETNSFIYVSYCVNTTITRIVRYEWTRQNGPRSPAVIFETELADPRDEWHRIGSMGFEDDEVMWFLVGDHFINEAAQDVESPLGALHRIIPNREPDGKGYTVPTGNMQASGLGGASAMVEPFESIYAYGLRSPWRGTRDDLGRFFVGDVGLGTFEEVNLVSEAGQNFGWDTHEGPCKSECDGFVDPIAWYDRSADHPYREEDPLTILSGKRAIWVGEIYQNPSVDRYEGMMGNVVAFGDLFTGWVRGLRADEDGQVTMDQAIGHLGNVTQWKVAPNGYVYVLDLSGQIYVALLDFEEE